MAYENVRIKESNMTVVDGYFYTFDTTMDALLKKNGEGQAVMTYPTDISLDQEILSLEHDGVFFWSLERKGSNDGLILRKWKVSAFQALNGPYFSITMTDDASNIFDADAMSIEHYHCSFEEQELSGSNPIKIADLSDLTFLDTPSDIMLTLGPSTHSSNMGATEEVTISSRSGNSITLTGGTTYSYEAGDPINFYRYAWFFNNYNGTNGDAGAIYRVSLYPPYPVLNMTSGGTYQNVTACTYIYYDAAAPYGDYLVFVKNAQLLFMDVNNSFAVVKSMVMNNVEPNQSTVIPVHDIAVEGDNVYRLQQKATIDGVLYSWSNPSYNYQQTTLTPFVHSINVGADPIVVAADGVQTSTITAVVRDQYDVGVGSGKRVDFSDDSATGAIAAPGWANTDADGKAVIQYTAGTEAEVVTITAQVDDPSL